MAGSRRRRRVGANSVEFESGIYSLDNGNLRYGITFFCYTEKVMPFLVRVKVIFFLKHVLR